MIGVSSRAPRFYALNACAIQQAHTRGNLTSTVCCFGKPCLNTRLQLLCVLVSDREPHGVVPPSSGRTVLQVPMGQADCAKTRSQSADRSSLHTFGGGLDKTPIRKRYHRRHRRMWRCWPALTAGGLQASGFRSLKGNWSLGKNSR